MSEALIFGIGSVLFIAITWAAVAFGVQRIHELEVADLRDSERRSVPRDDGLTELHTSEQKA